LFDIKYGGEFRQGKRGVMTSDPKVDTSHVTVHKLPPATRRRNEAPRWEVRAQGQAIGWVEARHLGKGHTLFYFATGIHPESRREYRLEGTTDFDERVNAIADFYRDPLTQRQHLGGYSGTAQA
jgi:hypothetical protein